MVSVAPDKEVAERIFLKLWFQDTCPPRWVGNILIATFREGDKASSFLGKLTEKERIVFMLRYNLFLDNKTIADKTGTSNGYIRNMLARTRKKLKKFLRRTEQ